MREQNDRGSLEFGGNELTVKSIIDDPAALRLASPFGTNKICGNDLDLETGTQYEKTQIQLTKDEVSGCFRFFATVNGRTDDKGQIEIARLSLKGFEVFVPFIQSPMPPIPPPPPDGTDPTHGIPAGDFARILQVYGFASDWQEVYAQGRVTWVQVIEKQDERDDYAHFPKAPIPPAITPEEQAERFLDVAAMQGEWPGMDLNNVESYLQGRSSPKEFHDENADRAGFHNLALHRPGRPY